jgi:hypothetical protein
MRALALVALAVSCSSSEPAAQAPERVEPPITVAYTQALEQICAAEVRSGAVASFPFADKMGTIRGWLDARLTDASARTLFFEQLPQLPVEWQGDTLRAEAERAAVGACPIGALYDFMADLPRKGLGTEECIAACVERNRGAVEDLAETCATGCGG